MSITTVDPTDHAITPRPSTTSADHRLTRHRGDDIAAVADAARSEWIKLRTLRSTPAIIALTVVIGVLLSWILATFVKTDPDTDLPFTVGDTFIFSTWLTTVLAVIMGTLLFTSEVQHGTLAGSLTAHPSRWPVVAAKILVATGFGLLLGVVGMATGFVGALAGGIEVGDTSGVMTTVLWGLLYTVGSALLGLGVGMVVRHSAGAVSGVLVWWLVVESLVVQFAPAEVVRFVPFDTGFRTLGIESDFDVPEVVAAGLSNPLHASIFWGYVLAALAIGAVLVHRRDAD